MEKKELEIIENGFSVFDMDLLAEEVYGGNNCVCNNNTSGCGAASIEKLQ